MKWYQPIECDNVVKNPLVCDFDNLDEFGFDEKCFVKGNIINNWSTNIYFQSSKRKNDGNPDDVLQNHLMIPIFAPRLIEELKNAGIGGIQYLPVKILQSNNDLLNGYCIANITNFIEALDIENSIYSRFSEDFPNPNVRGKISRVKKYVLMEEKVKRTDIVRLQEYKLSFFVSEKFKNIFENGKFSGYSFREVELS